MVDVDFEEQSWQTSRFEDEVGSNSKIINLVLKTGLVKNPKQANYALIGLVIFLFTTAIFVFWLASNNSSS